MTQTVVRQVTSIAVVLAFMVVMLGAYTRLTDAGLGCPDWPGCYGKLVLPKESSQLELAQKKYPKIQLETNKAWTEMVHRYAAGTLGLFIFFIAIASAILRDKRKWTMAVPTLLLLLIFFQAMLGMWTVTLKLLPIVVMGHLLGGMLIFASLCYLRWQQSQILPAKQGKLKIWIALGAMIVFIQIALGGWVSANYAGVACIGFPTCNGMWLPTLNFNKAFHLFSSTGANYQGGVLDNEARLTIQFVHRIFAVFTLIYILVLSTLLIRKINHQVINRLAIVAMLLVLIQFSLGIINVVYLLPLWAAVAHNGVASLLLATCISLLYLSKA